MRYYLSFCILLIFSTLISSQFCVAQSWDNVLDSKDEVRQPITGNGTSGWNRVFTGEKNTSTKKLDQTAGTSSKKETVVFIQGHESTSLFDNTTNSPEANVKAEAYQESIRQTFAGQNVEFVLRPTRKEFVQAVSRADVLYVSAHHGSNQYNGMQWVAVTPSADNPQISEGGASLVTSGDIKEAVKQGKAPKIVIFTACAGIATPGVEKDGLFSTAFGALSRESGKAFVGWEGFIKGTTGDRVFSEIFNSWVTAENDGSYRAFGDVFDAFAWGKEWFKKPILVGDSSILFKNEDENTGDGNSSSCATFHEYNWLGDDGRNTYTFNSSDKTYKYYNGSNAAKARTGKWTLRGNTLSLAPDTSHSATCKSTTSAKFNGDCTLIVGVRTAGSGCFSAGKTFPWKARRVR